MAGDEQIPFYSIRMRTASDMNIIHLCIWRIRIVDGQFIKELLVINIPFQLTSWVQWTFERKRKTFPFCRETKMICKKILNAVLYYKMTFFLKTSSIFWLIKIVEIYDFQTFTVLAKQMRFNEIFLEMQCSSLCKQVTHYHHKEIVNPRNDVIRSIESGQESLFYPLTFHSLDDLRIHRFYIWMNILWQNNGLNGLKSLGRFIWICWIWMNIEKYENGVPCTYLGYSNESIQVTRMFS